MSWQQLKTDSAARARLVRRAAVLKAVRAFFDAAGFLEVETPVLVRCPGMEPNLDVFATQLHDARGQAYPAHLTTSPEYAMKKLLAAGYDRIFNITKAFRDCEPWDGSHNPEFTMIEWYRSPAEYEAIMEDMEQMVAAAVAVTGGTTITYQGQTVDLAAPWPRLTVAEAMREYAGVDLDHAIDDPTWFRAEAVAKGCTVTPNDSWDDVFFKIFLRDVEPKLGTCHCERSEAISPTATSEIASSASGLLATTDTPLRPIILHEYPRSMAALARLKPGDPRYALRFEAYCCGLELANAFAELNDAAEQRARLEEESAERQRLNRSPWAIDEDFLAAVGEMPPASGIAFGLDRLVMLLTDAPSIREVLFFPADTVWGKPKE
jgi:elongation factor P--(R)-beta-lysine ligase